MTIPSLVDRRDRDLVARVGAGDEEAFRELFRRYAPASTALAARIVRQAFLAEEIVQEAFLAVWQRAGEYREDRGSVRSWLLSTVHHRAVDAVRREEAQRRRTREQASAAVVEVPDAATADVGETVVEDEDLRDRRRGVRTAMAGLPPEQRRILEAMYFEGRTQSQIAQETGIPLGTVKSRTVLAMRRLRAALEMEQP